MRIIFIAPPGAGKGTQSALITRDFGTPSVSTGNLLRAAIKAQTDFGKIAEQYINDGNYVPDEVVIKLIETEISTKECAEQGFILDGFPRTLYQAMTLDKSLVKHGVTLDAVLILYVPKTELIERLAARRICLDCGSSFHMLFNPPKIENVCDNCSSDLVHRADDHPEAIKQRIINYNKLTIPIIDHYEDKGLIQRINGMGEIDDVYKRIRGIVSGL